MYRILLLISLLYIGKIPCFAQTEYNELSKALAFPEKLNKFLVKQESQIENKIARHSEIYFRKLKKQELKLKRVIEKQDSALAVSLQLGSDSMFISWNSIMSNKNVVLENLPGSYSGKIDSMTAALKFLNKEGQIIAVSGRQFEGLIGQYNKIGSTINEAEHLKQMVQARKALLKEKLANLKIGKSWSKYQKQVIYYQLQMQQYKAVLEEPALLEKKVLEILSQNPAFRKFFDKYSLLGSMFRLPGQVEDMDPSVLLAGLQTRSSVLDAMGNQFGGVPNIQEAMSSGLKDGQQHLAGLRDKLANSLIKGEHIEMPGFKPNDQKTKSFFKRLELGMNLQSTRGNDILPIRSDIGISLGYKINNRSIIGLGMAYKMGWGKDIRHITISHEGIGLRTFIDVKVKESLWITGGAEWNYYSRFQDLSVLKLINTWQQSALIGIQKKQVLGKYKATASLLYDMLWNQHIPQSQPVQFRIGYNFK